MKKRIKLNICLIGNILVMSLVIILVSVLGEKSKYWRWGPHPDLILISTKINTWTAYGVTITLITLVKGTAVLVNEMGLPVLGFSIYNPDKKHITEFTKNSLQFYGNAMFLTNAIRDVFMIMVSITQIDLALWGVFISEFASIFAIRSLLNEKTFGTSTKEFGTSIKEFGTDKEFGEFGEKDDVPLLPI